MGLSHSHCTSHKHFFFLPLTCEQDVFLLHKSAFCQLVSLKILYICIKQCCDVCFYASVSTYWVCPMAGEKEFWFAGVCFQSTNFHCKKINLIKKKKPKNIKKKKDLDCYESFLPVTVYIIPIVVLSGWTCDPMPLAPRAFPNSVLIYLLAAYSGCLPSSFPKHF